MDILIFVTLGTQDKPFTRLLNALDLEIQNGKINDEVIVQAGFTKFKSENMKIFDLVPQNDFINYIKKADLIITHGGIGSIITALKFRKKVIAVPRLSKFGEHVNDHQIQIVKCFEKKKYILPLYDVKGLSDVINSVDDFHPEEFESNIDNFLFFIEKLINQ